MVFRVGFGAWEAVQERGEQGRAALREDGQGLPERGNIYFSAVVERGLFTQVIIISGHTVQ